MSRPTIERFEPRELGPKEWGTELLVAHTSQYVGKVSWMHAGEQGPLQYHEHKDETVYVFSGCAWVDFDSGTGLVRCVIDTGSSIHIPPGAVHRVGAVTDCVLFEASTPHFEDRVNVEDQYV